MAAPVEDRGAIKLRAVTPTDSKDLPDGHCRALFIGVGGDVAIVAATDSTAITLKNCASGQIVPVRCAQVYSTGTTATNIVAMY